MPVSMFTYMVGYSIDKMCHCFWSKNATKACDDEEDIRGKIVIVTGSNCGIGQAVATQLAKREAVVIMAVRDVEKGRLAKEEIDRQFSYSVVVVKKLDLADIESIYNFVKEFESHYNHLHLLVNNAGIMYAQKKRQTTKDGFELNMGVNHLGTFLLTKLLLESLKKGAPSRVITLASSNLTICKLDLDDLMMEKRIKSGDGYREQYNISKLAIAMCMRKLITDIRTREDKEDWKHVKFYIMCPGYVKSPLFRYDEGCCRKCRTRIGLCGGGISVHKGAETVCYLCLSQSVADNEGVGNGEMYRFMKVWKTGERILKEMDGSEQMERLYKLTEQLLESYEHKRKESPVADQDT